MLQPATNTDVFKHYPYCVMTWPDLEPKDYGLLGALAASVLVFLKSFNPHLARDMARMETKLDAVLRDSRETAADVKDIDRRLARMEGQGD